MGFGCERESVYRVSHRDLKPSRIGFFISGRCLMVRRGDSRLRIRNGRNEAEIRDLGAAESMPLNTAQKHEFERHATIKQRLGSRTGRMPSIEDNITPNGGIRMGLRKTPEASVWIG